MKVKIRGLVFAGFAAAVFAQSASAEITDSDKTVTSKTYVDSKIEGTSNNATTITSTSSDTNAPSLLNVYKFVENQIVSSGGGIDGDPTKHTQKIAVFDSSYTTPVGTPENPQGEDLNHIIGWKLIVPDAAVAGTGAAIGGTTQNPGPADGTDLTTAQAVYDFVNGGAGTGFQRKLRSGEKPSLGVYNADGTSVWKQATGGTYVAVAEPQGGTSITFDIDSTKIATIGADDPTTQGVNESEITADSTKLTTGKAVYEFVTQQVNEAAGDFQPKLTAAQASAIAGWGAAGQAEEGAAIAVGYRGTGASDDSEWKIFGARGNGSGTNDDYHLSYLTVQPGSAQERDKYFIDIKAGALAKDVIAINTGGTATGDTASLTADKLTTAKAVYDYAVKQQWDATNDVGKHLVIDSDGKVTVSTTANPDIPLPTACATGDNVCALVAHLNSAGTGIEYEWTVMAGTGN